MKRCKVCNKEFELNVYNKICCSKECYKVIHKELKKKSNKLRYENKKEELLKKHKIWRDNNKEHLKESDHRKYLRNIDKRKQQAIIYYNKNVDKLKQGKRLRYKENPKHFLKINHEYNQTPQGKLIKSMIGRKRRAKVNNVIHAFTKDEWKAKLELTKGVCPCCNENIGIMKLTLDHIKPISKVPIGFIYTIDDVMPLCKPCNSSKGNRV